MTLRWNEQTAEVCTLNKKRYCLCCIKLIRIDTFYQKISRIIFKICFSRSCSPSWATKQTYFGNFTCLQIHFGHPKPSGKCCITPLINLSNSLLVINLLLIHLSIKSIKMYKVLKYENKNAFELFKNSNWNSLIFNYSIYTRLP